MASNTLSREHEPSYGKLTWEEEGKEGGKFHSRKLHVPNNKSGATIGRGYDMKTKGANEIRTDMASIELKKEFIDKLVLLAGLAGDEARNKIEELGLKEIEILEPSQQLALFKISYSKEAQEASRICMKSDVVDKYGECNWSTMNQHLKEFIIDLKYQGLYRPDTRAFLQEAIASRNYVKLKEMVQNKLPKEYMKRNLQRIKLLEQAENFDKFNRILPAKLDKGQNIA